MSKSRLDALKAVYQWVTRTMMKNQTGVMQTLPNRELIEFNTQITAQRLMQAGVDPTTLKNANQVENAINIIESRPVQEGIKSTKAGKVFDMEGQEIPQGSRIIGGKAVKETEEEIAARMSKENKEAAERIRKQKESKKILEDYETSEAKLREKLKPKSTTSLDDEIKQAYDKAVKENKFKNVRLRDGREIKSEDDFREYIDELNEDSNFAIGGRAGFANGSDDIRVTEGLRSDPEVAKQINEFLKNKAINDAIKQAPEGVLMDPPPEPNYSFIETMKTPKDTRKPLDIDNYIEFDDGTVFYKDTGEYYDMNTGKQTTGPSKGAKIVPRILEAAEGGRIGLASGTQFELPFGKPDYFTGKGKNRRGIYIQPDGTRLVVPIGPDDLPSYAMGGRIGLKDGPDMPSRRKFIKIMGGIASLPFIGKYIKPAIPIIQKGAEITGPALDKIIQTVMSAGKLISQSGRRVKEMVTKKKLKDVEVEEDIMDGPSYTIKTKDKTIYYKPGRQDEMGIEDDIIEVIEDTVTKKAGGGIAKMLGE